MLTPYQITINTSTLPQLAQQAITSIDLTLQTWQIDEGGKLWSLTWASAGGWTQNKEDSLRQLIAAYGSLGWQTNIRANQTTFKVWFSRP
jgi:hypothetical protein